MTPLDVEAPMPSPLRVDEDGVVRVGATRVTLDSVVFAFDQGDTPEQVVDSFPTLKLADVYGTFGYILEHHQKVRAYVDARAAEAEQARAEDVARPEVVARRRRLKARWRRLMAEREQQAQEIPEYSTTSGE